jgi:HNH endonuclease
MDGFDRCTVDGCTRLTHHGGTAALCAAHYSRLRRWGDVRADLPIGGPSPEERFWAKVDKRGPDDCWEWTGAKSGVGYGSVRWRGRRENAHRVAYQLVVGQIPEGMHGLHHCDNPPCVNPAHIYVGNQSDNAQDRSKRKRNGSHMGAGELNGSAKFTRSQVEDMRNRAVTGPRGTKAALVREYGVSRTQLGRILSGTCWR